MSETNDTSKMRKTLTLVVDACSTITKMSQDSAFVETWAEETKKVALEALSAPPRNCDVFETETEMRKAFIDWYNETWDLKGSKYEIEMCDLKHDVEGILHEYIQWLFSSVHEHEGDE